MHPQSTRCLRITALMATLLYTCSSASGAITATFAQEAINGTPVHTGTDVVSSSTDILNGLLPTASDQGWPAIGNMDQVDLLTDGDINTSSPPRFIGGEPTASNFVEYDLGGAFDIGHVSVFGSWNDRTGQAWSLTFSTDGVFDTETPIFTLNGLDDDGFVPNFTDDVANVVTVFDPANNGTFIFTGATHMRIDFGQDDISWNVYREIDVSQDFITGVVVPVDGDVDGDGDVDIEDYNTIRDNFRMTSAAQADGDLTGDGVVNFEDFLEWQENFPTAASGSFTVIPEPATAILFAAIASAGAFVGRRRQ